jgi:small-conductance mechanosensitive channel
VLTILMAHSGRFITTAGIALLIGVVLDVLVRPFLRRRAASRGWRAAEVFAGALRGLPTALGALAAVRILAGGVGLGADAMLTARNWTQALVIIVVTISGADLVGKLVRLYTQREGTRLPSSSVFVHSSRAIVLAVGLVSVLGALNVEIAPLLTALGVGGLAVGLALQETLANLFSGIQIVVSRQIEPGDFIGLPTGEKGWVEDVTWRNTTIRLATNDLVIVPNAVIGRSLVTNHTTLGEQHSVFVTARVAFGSDLETVERVTIEAARRVQAEFPDATRDFDPIVRFTTMGDTGVELQATLHVEVFAQRQALRHEFLKLLSAAFLEAGVALPESA